MAIRRHGVTRPMQSHDELVMGSGTSRCLTLFTLRQYAPRCEMTAGIVRARIEMSSQIDQLSR